ncbi:MAG: LptF/LptG family permease [Meiothermus sp.]|uniref:LptF/LptG family permease n=1 Tax=Meiothermus sp. TaxID=1955249 RepID=UPI0025E28CBC|nr:LptF/LptG family permease [Meiothermus sp.]MCS7067365.1 LptF/LptG family permease [Meiothermus sp.]MCX7601459.1 LptF/LptG family permease [Meiothermus sp.]MDW8424686.1 LptF/LptG family permease [Meiothermus sp.]
MTHLDRYILREAVPIFLFGLLLYVGFGLISNLLPRAQWMGTAELGSILKWLALQVPAASVQALPVAGLLSILLAFGRLARENELLVMQAGGISVLRTARLFLWGGLLMSGLSLALSEWVVPWANRATAVVYWNELIPERTPQYNLIGRELSVGEYTLRYEGFDKPSDQLLQVRLERWQGQTMTVILAQSARLQGSVIVFRDYKVFTLDFARLPLPDFATLEQAEAGLREVFRAQNIGPPGAELSVRLSRSREDLEAQYAGGGFETPVALSEWWRKLQNPSTPPRELREAKAQWHSGIALALGNLMVLILALPIAVRRATSPGTALALALVLTIAYYVAFSTGKVLALTSSLPPEVAAWSANLLGMVVGLWLGKGIYR